MHADIGVRDVGARSATVSADTFEPSSSFTLIRGTERPGAVVLSSAQNVPQGIPHVDRKALELQRRQALVHAENLRRYGAEPLMALGEQRIGKAAGVATGGTVGEGATRPDYTAVGADDRDVRPARDKHNGVLVRMHSQRRRLCIVRHVREAHARIGGALYSPPIRRRVRCKDFSILHFAEDPYRIWAARRRSDHHVVGALLQPQGYAAAEIV